ncbi:hypothetical protein Lery_2331 [Legionella erythra]|uniref:Uncharacterized protein n=1 Tax=Legionella erythra TaxID=448 RepID=A0A0W0TEY0_LEGER|nr:hypothetical protein Lery_2331 [Legionella erythra]
MGCTLDAADKPRHVVKQRMVFFVLRAAYALFPIPTYRAYALFLIPTYRAYALFLIPMYRAYALFSLSLRTAACPRYPQQSKMRGLRFHAMSKAFKIAIDDIAYRFCQSQCSGVHGVKPLAAWFFKRFVCHRLGMNKMRLHV